MHSYLYNLHQETSQHSTCFAPTVSTSDSPAPSVRSTHQTERAATNNTPSDNAVPRRRLAGESHNLCAVCCHMGLSRTPPETSSDEEYCKEGLIHAPMQAGRMSENTQDLPGTLLPPISHLSCRRISSRTDLPPQSGRASKKRVAPYSIVTTTKIPTHLTIQYNILLLIFIGFYSTDSDIAGKMYVFLLLLMFLHVITCQNKLCLSGKEEFACSGISGAIMQACLRRTRTVGFSEQPVDG
jgi:hypothetical protein